VCAMVIGKLTVFSCGNPTKSRSGEGVSTQYFPPPQEGPAARAGGHPPKCRFYGGEGEGGVPEGLGPKRQNGRELGPFWPKRPLFRRSAGLGPPCRDWPQGPAAKGRPVPPPRPPGGNK